MNWNDREFEPVICEAMRARPEPGSISNLAYRAMQRAREQARIVARRQLEGLMRLRRRGRWVGAVGAVMIAVVVLVGAKKVAESGVFGTASAVTSSESGTSDSTSTTSSTDTMSIGVGLMAELLVVVLILLSVGAASYRKEASETVYY